MAVASLADILSDACTNGFTCVPVGQAQILELQLIYVGSGSTATLEELVASASTNNFLTLPAGMAELVEIQLLYLISGSTSTLAELQADSCSSGFACIDSGSRMQSTVDLQLWYVASGSAETVAELQAAVCTNQFSCLKPFSRLLTAIKLQLLYEVSGSVDTLADLLADACTNGFMCLDPDGSIASSLIEQLTFEVSENGMGVTCAVTGITNGGGDTFDCYADGDATTQTLDQGTGLGQWVEGGQGAALATDWANRVVANGGAAPSSDSVAAVSNLLDGLAQDGLLPKAIILGVFAPDSLTACITPVIVGPGSDPWVNFGGNFLAGDLTVNGLVGNGVNKRLLTGFNPSTELGGLTVSLVGYLFTNPVEVKPFCGCKGATAANESLCVFPGINSPAGEYIMDAFNESTAAGGGRLRFNYTPSFTGYVCGSRIDLGGGSYQMDIYSANSSTPHASRGNKTTTNTTIVPNAEFSFFDRNGPTGEFSSVRMSFGAVFEGLTAAESSDLYDRVQQLREDFGGGFI